MSQHTKEPWKLAYRGCEGAYDIDAAGGDISLALNVGEANARRIVTCVNACAGLPTKPLERLIAGGGRLAAADFIVDAMDRQLEETEQQRDRLLLALESALPGLRKEHLKLAEKYAGTVYESDPAYVAIKDRYENARTAIAAVKGGA